MSKTSSIRILFWNIWHGGGNRAGRIVDQVLEWSPDIIALAEFRGTQPSKSIAKHLFDSGYEHQLSTVNPDEAVWNALFLASRYELSNVDVRGAPETDLYWLLAKVQTDPALHIGVIHVPLEKYLPGFWLEYRKSLLNIARDWKLGPSLFVGDMNSAISGLDEETEYSQGYKESFMNPLESLGWRDIFRAYHPAADAPTWVSRIGRGFRLDQAFVNDELQTHVRSCDYDWGCVGERGKASDHAALLLDLNLPG
ncbi:MAG: endonuclease/exonuclease/phosphatase family protein [Chloroflexi bacterium]|nr:endonuclease/exonuclease/phosphatase family protein [Chloroflexota bacterium]